jgi:hypothetical protein
MTLLPRYTEQQISVTRWGPLKFTQWCKLREGASRWPLSPKIPQTKLDEHLFCVYPNCWQRKQSTKFRIYRRTLTISYPSLVVNRQCTDFVRQEHDSKEEFVSILYPYKLLTSNGRQSQAVPHQSSYPPNQFLQLAWKSWQTSVARPERDCMQELNFQEGHCLIVAVHFCQERS